MSKEHSTMSIGIINGIQIISPNKVLFDCDEIITLNEKNYDGFYISYNNHDTNIYGCNTTAIVLGQMEYFLILNGNHSENLVKIAAESGITECIAYFKEHADEINKLSDKL